MVSNRPNIAQHLFLVTDEGNEEDAIAETLCSQNSQPSLSNNACCSEELGSLLHDCFSRHQDAKEGCGSHLLCIAKVSDNLAGDLAFRKILQSDE